MACVVLAGRSYFGDLANDMSWPRLKRHLLQIQLSRVIVRQVHTGVENDISAHFITGVVMWDSKTRVSYYATVCTNWYECCGTLCTPAEKSYSSGSRRTRWTPLRGQEHQHTKRGRYQGSHANLAAVAPHNPGFQTVIFSGFPRVYALSICTSGRD